MFDDDYEYEIRDDDYIDEDEDENALWDDEDSSDTEADDSPDKPKQKRRKKNSEDISDAGDPDEVEAEQSEQTRRQITLEQNIIDNLEADAKEHPIEDAVSDEEPERKKLQRELRAEALARLEDAARNTRDFENVIAWWDKLDANRERRERYHELSRNGDDIPLDYGAFANDLFFPDYLNDALEKQIRKGDFLDAIFNCPYDIHELVTDEYLCQILCDLDENHKELLFLCAVRLFSSTRIAAIRGRSDRNIRKVRATMFKKIRKKLLAALMDKHGKQQLITLLEKEFLADNSDAVEAAKKK